MRFEPITPGMVIERFNHLIPVPGVIVSVSISTAIETLCHRKFLTTQTKWTFYNINNFVSNLYFNVWVLLFLGMSIFVSQPSGGSYGQFYYYILSSRLACTKTETNKHKNILRLRHDRKSTLRNKYLCPSFCVIISIWEFILACQLNFEIVYLMSFDVSVWQQNSGFPAWRKEK